MNDENGNDSSANCSTLANSCDELIMKEKTLIPIRYVIVILSFFSCFIMLLLRLNLSVAIVSMVNHTALYQANPVLNNSNVIDGEEGCSGQGSNQTNQLEIAVSNLID